MTQQSSQLRTLQRIFRKAIKSGKANIAAKDVILSSMQLSASADNVIVFYGILSNAVNEANSLKLSSAIDKDILQDSLQSITKLNRFFVENNIWNTQWQKFAIFLRDAHYTLLLDNLSNYYYSAYKLKAVDDEDLKKIAQEVENLLENVRQSELSFSIKQALISYLDRILQVISRYQIDGTEGLQKVAKSMMTDLLLSEKTISLEDHQQKTFNKVKGFALGFFLWACPSPSDMISIVPAIEEYWLPNYEQFIQKIDDSQRLVKNSPSLYEAYLRTSQDSSSIPMNASLESLSPKSLPQSKQDEEEE